MGNVIRNERVGEVRKVCDGKGIGERGVLSLLFPYF